MLIIKEIKVARINIERGSVFQCSLACSYTLWLVVHGGSTQHKILHSNTHHTHQQEEPLFQDAAVLAQTLKSKT